MLTKSQYALLSRKYFCNSDLKRTDAEELEKAGFKSRNAAVRACTEIKKVRELRKEGSHIHANDKLLRKYGRKKFDIVFSDFNTPSSYDVTYRWAPEFGFTCDIELGDQYSRRCTFRRRNYAYTLSLPRNGILIHEFDGIPLAYTRKDIRSIGNISLIRGTGIFRKKGGMQPDCRPCFVAVSGLSLRTKDALYEHCAHGETAGAALSDLKVKLKKARKAEEKEQMREDILMTPFTPDTTVDARMIGILVKSTTKEARDAFTRLGFGANEMVTITQLRERLDTRTIRDYDRRIKGCLAEWEMNTLTLDTLVDAAWYQKVTGACTMGTNEWAREHGMTRESRISIRELSTMLRSRDYGYDRIMRLVKRLEKMEATPSPPAINSTAVCPAPSGTDSSGADSREKTTARHSVKKPAATKCPNRLFSPYVDELFDGGRIQDRKYYLHIGPTNSGKTHDAIDALTKASSGMYLGPLRLLALEMYDKLNSRGIPCSLLTGEEQLITGGAKVTASTIEMCDYDNRYDVVVIDEAQMIAEPDRGAAWTRAILSVNAAAVHICLAPEAKNIITEMLRDIGADYECRYHERLVPLTYAGELGDIIDVEPGDAVITFSRKNVLFLSAKLELAGKHTSVIYGSLPPEVRRSEVERYLKGETQYIVATDAIGQGISLPIKRIVFAETRKYDGKTQRDLLPSEIRQIAGRAGRYGMYDEGKVLGLKGCSPQRIEAALRRAPEPLSSRVMPFPAAAVGKGVPLRMLFKEWEKVSFRDGYIAEDVTDKLALLSELERSEIYEMADDPLVYRLISFHFKHEDMKQIYYWLDCCRVILGKGYRDGAHPEAIPHVRTQCYDLADYEDASRMLDIRHQSLRLLGVTEDDSAARKEVFEGICEELRKDFQKRYNINAPKKTFYRFDDYDYDDYGDYGGWI